MKIIIIVFCVLISFAGCKSKNNESGSEDKKTAETKPKEAENGIIEITAAQMKAAQITTDTMQLKELSATVKVNGLLTVPNQNKALVTSVTNGIIKTLLIQPGTLVQKGQIIATIVNPEVAQLQQQLLVANAQLKMAKLEQERQKELVEGNAAPLKNLQRVNTELATLAATSNALQQQLRAMGISPVTAGSGRISTTLNIAAPITGTVSEVMAQIGSNVDAASPIAHIVNNAQLHLDIFVYEKDLPRIKEKQTIHFMLTNLQGKEYDAEIYSIGAAFANDTKTIPVHAIVKGNKAGLIDGMNITALISTGINKVPTVPSEAIVTNAGQDYIFILANEQEKQTQQRERDSTNKAGKETNYFFQKVAVLKGVTDLGFTEITIVNPIPKTARIVIKGAFFVLAKMTNKGEQE